MPMKAKIFFSCFVSIGIVLILAQFMEISIIHIPSIITLAIIAGALEKYHVELPNGVELSGSTIFTMLALVHFGIPEALIIDLVVSLFLLFLYKLRFFLWLLNASQFAITVVLTGFFMEQFMTDAFRVTDWRSILVFIVGTGIYIVVGYTLSSICISFLYSRKMWESWVNGIMDSFLGFAVTTVLGLRLVSVYDSQDTLQFWIETGFVVGVFLALRHSFQLFINLRKTYTTSLETITHFVEQKLNTMSGHSTRVGNLAKTIAEELKLPQEEIDAIHYAAILHDIGKLQIKQGIFNKRGPLTLDEERQYRQHPELGANMVEEVSGFSKSVEYIRFHHEQWDGKGYPEGKQGQDIPLGARIIAVANEYDHLVHASKDRNLKAAFQSLMENKLDPELVGLVLRISDFKAISQPSQRIDDQVMEEKVMGEINNKFNDSKLLRDFGAGHIVYFQDGEFLKLNGEPTGIPCRDYVVTLMKEGADEYESKHEFIQDPSSKKIYNIHWVVIGSKVYVLFFDVSNFIEYENKQEVKIRRIYRDVIHSVTQGKLLLLEKDELDKYYSEEKIQEVSVQEKEDVSLCRKTVERLLEGCLIEDKKRYNILLSVSEAVTNVLKHATEGKMKVYLNDGWIKVIVEDKGSGIKLSELPRSTLLEGYSTKMSMGHGFGLMLKLLDKIALYTSKEGTTVILEAKVANRE
ncbi:HD domain-containing phosphohydrolase [Peribacillus acanthi]|uniref:HD domain-containing phosphohydrolase n=1 Tax=Peribacillus acanthi TaxID=2171554 RepID=UPI000D3E7862|nr:HD domain-containing phosphohydrolase [Peribacillus acanthi]